MKQSDDYKAIAQRIKQRRMELGLSLQEVADITDMSKSTLQRYESGSIRNIPLQKLGVLASALQTSADWILGWCKAPDDIPPIDADFRKFIQALGFTVQVWPGFKSNIYLHGDGIGHAQITKVEYENLRDSISAYVRFNATNLLKQALERDEVRIRKELGKMKELIKQAKEEKSKAAPALPTAGGDQPMDVESSTQSPDKIKTAFGGATMEVSDSILQNFTEENS